MGHNFCWLWTFEIKKTQIATSNQIKHQLFEWTSHKVKLFFDRWSAMNATFVAVKGNPDVTQPTGGTAEKQLFNKVHFNQMKWTI